MLIFYNKLVNKLEISLTVLFENKSSVKVNQLYMTIFYRNHMNETVPAGVKNNYPREYTDRKVLLLNMSVLPTREYPQRYPHKLILSWILFHSCRSSLIANDFLEETFRDNWSLSLEKKKVLTTNCWNHHWHIWKKLTVIIYHFH